jgi:hypothetical protein
MDTYRGCGQRESSTRLRRRLGLALDQTMDPLGSFGGNKVRSKSLKDETTAERAPEFLEYERSANFVV